MAVSSKRSTLLADTSSSPFTSSKFTDIPDSSLSLLGSTSSLFPYCGNSVATAQKQQQQQQQQHRKIGACRYENGRVNNWIEAMRASSPSRSTAHQSTPTPHSQDENNELKEENFHHHHPSNDYAQWLDTHPSALESFEKIMEASGKKKIAVFLDYDGTLSPIVENPDQAFMSDEMRAAVKEVAAHFPTAIISGRGRDKVRNFVELSELYYAGSHGMDIMGPANASSVDGTLAKDDNGDDIVLFQPAKEYLPMMDEVFDLLVQKASEIQGASVENNKFCITVHFRRVAEESWPLLAETVQNVLKDYPKLRLTQGRKVLEVRPSIEWDKGKAVEYLLHILGLEDSDSLPIYIGDDRTDEDAFDVFKQRQLGCGILVTRVAKETSASYSLREPAEVMKFLHTIVQWRRSNC